ncbi:MAG: DUF1501 domain-containing protein, partial [Verrucomicrobiales bacterium]
MNPIPDYLSQTTRRTFLGRSARGIGRTALGALLFPELLRSPAAGAAALAPRSGSGGLPAFPNFAPTAKRVIYLFQSGGPSHVELFDYKPALGRLNGTEVPASVMGNQRVTGMTANQKSYPATAPLWGIRQCGQQGTWIGDLLPHTQGIADDITIIRSVNTEAINHDPGIT